MRSALAAALALALLLTASGSPARAEEAQTDPSSPPGAEKAQTDSDSPAEAEEAQTDSDSTAEAEEAETDSTAGGSKPAGHGSPLGALSSDPQDPGNLLPGIQERLGEMDSLFPQSPLHGLHELTDRGKNALYDSIGLKLGLAYTQLFMGLSESLPGTDDWGTNSNVDFLATWDLLKRGEPTQGALTAHVQGRWDWGTTAPETLGTTSLGSLLGTANSFAPYTPAFLVRNLYWQQGSRDAGWAYRIGKITPDAILGTSAHLANILTFLPTANYNFSIAVPDSGLGATAVWYPHDRIRLLGLVSDANADRQDWGHISEGDLFYAFELGAQIFPRTEKAGYSKLVVWRTEGTRDGNSSNGNLGPSGWGFLLKLEQELTADGRLIGIARYGRSFQGSGFYRHQAGLNLLLYDPHFIGHIRNDLVGVAVNWVNPTQTGSLSEYDIEIFYRFPIFPQVDVTLSYQSIFHPVLDPDNNQASVFGLRLRTTF